jgi:hypothetical protein
MDTDGLDGGSCKGFQEKDIKMKDACKKVAHNTVSSTFNQCGTDAFNFLRTLNAEDFE